MGVYKHLIFKSVIDKMAKVAMLQRDREKQLPLSIFAVSISMKGSLNSYIDDLDCVGREVEAPQSSKSLYILT